MLVGLALFFVGSALFMGIVFSRGGAAKSRQFAVIAQLLRGDHGALSRGLAVAALLSIGVGTCGTFAGVASMNGARAERCMERCQAEGYLEGRTGPSVDRAPQTRFVACTCSGGGQEPLELRADSL
jgi:hypothetical protein